MFIRRYLAPDENNAGGGSQNTDAGANGAGNADPANSGGNADPNPNGGAAGNPPAGNAAPEKTHTQLDLDAVAARVRDEEKKKYEKKVADEKAATDRKEAEKQGEFQKLYTAETEKTAQLETQLEKLPVLSDKINAMIDGEIKDWPDSVKKALPGKDDVIARMTAVEANREMAKELLAARRAPNGEYGNRGKDPENADGKTAAGKYFANKQYAIPGRK